MKPLALDLCSGLGGWAEGLEAEGWDVIRVDIVDMFAELGRPKPPNCLLILQDILTFHGSQAKNCALIVASPPCQEFSWMAMPWSRAKQVARALRGEDEFPANYRGSRTVEQLTALFNACFRIQREASEAAGRLVPMVVENVKGAQPWVGRARWAFGSYFLWGDVPALMPVQRYHQRLKVSAGEQWNINRANFTGTIGWDLGRKNSGGSWFNVGSLGQKVTNQNPVRDAEHRARNHADAGIKQGGTGFHDADSASRTSSSKSPARKQASALIAKIPLPLSQHIARTFKPLAEASSGHSRAAGG